MLALARQKAFEAELDAADEALRALLARYPNDPLAAVARVMRARIALCGTDLTVAQLDPGVQGADVDPSLGRSAHVVRGLLAARQHDFARARALVRPLEGRLPDRAETADVACVLAEVEAEDGDPARALRSIAVLDHLVTDGASWLPTGLACEQPNGRERLLASALARVNEPEALTATLEQLPAESPLRRAVALRLRTVAETRGESARWIPWLADLPDEAATQRPVVPGATVREIVLGVLVPVHGERATLGVAVLRGVQLATESLDAVRPVPEDEGETPVEAIAALERLHALGATIVVGALREDLGDAVAERAEALGIEVWILAPGRSSASSAPPTAHVHRFGPDVATRTEALVSAVRALLPNAVRAGASSTVTVLAAPPLTPVRAQLIARLNHVGIQVRAATVHAASVPPSAGWVVAVGTFGREARGAMARAAQRSPTRWIFEARSVAAGTDGNWVGLARGPGFDAMSNAHCLRAGEAPDELVSLAYDAVQASVAAARSHDRPETVLAADHAVVFQGREANGADETLAANVRCPAASAAPIDAAP